MDYRKICITRQFAVICTAATWSAPWCFLNNQTQVVTGLVSKFIGNIDENHANGETLTIGVIARIFLVASGTKSRCFRVVMNGHI